jgi:hypothetical protein
MNAFRPSELMNFKPLRSTTISAASVASTRLSSSSKGMRRGHVELADQLDHVHVTITLAL